MQSSVQAGACIASLVKNEVGFTVIHMYRFRVLFAKDWACLPITKKKAKLGNSGILFQNLNLIIGKSMKIAVLLLSSKQNTRNLSIQNYIELLQQI